MQCRLQAIGRVITMLTLFFAGSAATAESYPSKPLTLLVGYAPGSATDVLARTSQPLLQKALAQTVVVDNAPGASGSIGVRRMLGAADAAHTLYLGTAGDFILAPLQIPGSKHKAEDAELIGATGYPQLAFFSRNSLNVADVDGLIACLKNPGSVGLSYASSDTGSVFHLAMEQLVRTTGTPLVHVPYLSLCQILTNVVGSQDESTSQKGFYFDIWVDPYAPAGTAQFTLERRSAVFGAAQSSPEFKRFADVNGVAVLDKSLTLDQTGKYYVAVTDKYRSLAKAVKLGVD